MTERRRQKGRGRKGDESNRPTCPHCNEDLKVSLEYVEMGKAPKKYGYHCSECEYQVFIKNN